MRGVTKHYEDDQQMDFRDCYLVNVDYVDQMVVVE